MKFLKEMLINGGQNSSSIVNMFGKNLLTISWMIICMLDFFAWSSFGTMTIFAVNPVKY